MKRVSIFLRPANVNGQSGAIAFDSQGRLLTVMPIDIADGRVRAVRSIVNPDKLRHLGEVGDLAGPTRRPDR